MEIGLSTFLIVCPLVFMGGFMGAIAGGGGLITLPAYLFAGIPIHNAIGTNKLSSLAGTIVAAIRYYRHNFIDVPLMLPSIAVALGGSIVGANIALLTEAKILEKLLLIVIPVTAFYVFKNKKFESNNAISRKKAFILSIVISFFLGTYDGFYGPGTGTFLILLYNGVAKIDIRVASGNAKFVNLASNMAAVFVYMYNGKVLFTLGLCAAVFNIIGAYIGAGFVIKKGVAIIRPIMFIMLALIFIKVATSQ